MRQEKRAPQDREQLTTAGTEKRGSLSFPIKPVATGISRGVNNAVKGQAREQEKPDFNSASKKLFKAGRSPSWMEMMSFLGMMIFLTSSVLVAQGNLGQFAFMIKALTGKHAIPNYTTYGCYCGLGGKGQARDATDRCCLVHDCCYDKLSKCNPKTNKYQYTYQNGVITCGPGSWCEIQICECDKAAAICFRENLNSYDQKLRFYWDIHCKEPTEPC